MNSPSHNDAGLSFRIYVCLDWAAIGVESGPGVSTRACGLVWSDISSCNGSPRSPLREKAKFLVPCTRWAGKMKKVPIKHETEQSVHMEIELCSYYRWRKIRAGKGAIGVDFVRVVHTASKHSHGFTRHVKNKSASPSKCARALSPGLRFSSRRPELIGAAASSSLGLRTFFQVNCEPLTGFITSPIICTPPLLFSAHAKQKHFHTCFTSERTR